MIDVPFALALTAGMVATVNPCGFAMLPAYLSFFVGVDRDGVTADSRGSVGRALVVGAAVSTGFAITFAVIGLVVFNVTSAVYEIGPWITVLIGVALVGFGIALLAGFEPSVRLPRLDKGGRTRGGASMVLFGVSYAVASLGCTLPLFVVQVAASFRSANLVSGVAFFLTYALGMGLVLTALTVALALARQSLVRDLRRVLPLVGRIAGALLVLTGAYVTYYGVYEIRFGSGSIPRDGVFDRVFSWSSGVADWIADTGATRVAGALALVVVGAIVFAVTRRAGCREAEVVDTRDRWR
ncbi:cytochrome c biogenesis CcdA family protein [soil metagenome]